MATPSTSRPDLAARSLPLRSRRIAGAVGIFVALHLLVTTLYLAGTSFVPGPVHRLTETYLEPLLRQSWTVFAPDPGTAETRLQVRAETGQQPSPWVDLTACDIDSAVRHHPIPGRRYLTIPHLLDHYRGSLRRLPQAAAARLGADHTPGDLAAPLRAAGASPKQAEEMQDDAQAMTRLATQVALARGLDPQRVQVRIEERTLVPYRDRNTSRSPSSTFWTSGWAPADRATVEQATAVTASIYGPRRCPGMASGT